MNKTLRELAEAATPGPWEYESFGQRVIAESVGGCRLERSKFMLADIRGWGHLQYLPNGAEIQDANGAYIAAASPDAILKLLDRIAELEAKLAALESQKPVAWNDPDDLLADTAFRWCRIDAFVRPVYLAAGAKPAATGDVEGYPV
jgi:hypothetical protein